MAYSDIQNKVGQTQMANHILLAKSRKDRDDARKKKKDKINLRKQQDKIKADEEKRLKEDSEYYRGQDPNAKIYNRDGQEVLNDGSIVVDEDMRTNGPIIDPNSLLQIGGAAGSIIPFMSGQMLRYLFGPQAMAKAPYTLNPQRIMLPSGQNEYAPINLRSDEQKERQHMMIYGGKWNKPIR